MRSRKRTIVPCAVSGKVRAVPNKVRAFHNTYTFPAHLETRDLQQIIHSNISHAFEQVCLERGASFRQALDFFADGLAVACFREFAGTGELANVRVFGVGDDFAFFAVAERADNATRILFVRHHWRHPAELALV